MRALTGISTRKHFSKYAYLLKQVLRTYIDWGIVAKSPLGRYSCIAQGASPGLIIGTHLLSPKGAALPYLKQMLAPKVPLLIGAHIICCLCLPRVSYRALPSFHPGLFRSVVPTALIIRLNFDAVALQTNRYRTPYELFYLNL